MCCCWQMRPNISSYANVWASLFLASILCETVKEFMQFHFKVESYVFQESLNAAHICGSQVTSHHDKTLHIKFLWCHTWHMIPHCKSTLKTLTEICVFVNFLHVTEVRFKKKKKALKMLLIFLQVHLQC